MIPPLLSLEELLAIHYEPPQYVIEGLLAKGGLSMLVAHPKAGKSTLIRNMLKEVSLGKPFFNRPTHRGTLLYYALEEPKEHVTEEFRKLGFRSRTVYARLGTIDKGEILPTIHRDIEKVEASLVVVDPLFDALSVEDVNSYAKVNEAMKALLYIARTTNCHILTVHHTNKADLRGGPSVLGSQALAGATDCNMFLTLGRDGTRLFESQARVGEPIELTALGFDPVTHHIWLEKSAKEQRLEEMSQALLTVLGDTTMAFTDLRSRVKGRHSDKAAALEKLEREGKVLKTQQGRTTLWQKSA